MSRLSISSSFLVYCHLRYSLDGNLVKSIAASASMSAASSAYSNFDMTVVLSLTPTATPEFWRSCIRKIRSSPAINATGENMSPSRPTPLAMSNGSESVIVPSVSEAHYSAGCHKDSINRRCWVSQNVLIKVWHCIEFKYYADGVHSGLTPPG